MRNNQTPKTVRAIQSDDYKQWRELWLAYQEFYEVQLSEKITRASFERFLNPDEPVFSGVLSQDEKLLGFVNSVIHRSTWSLADYCYLEDLYVSPETRGTGAGKMLIEWVQKCAREHQCSRLYWHTHQTNKRAQSLYNRVAQDSGFIEYRMAL